jgi:hypothetical protein
VIRFALTLLLLDARLRQFIEPEPKQKSEHAVSV